MAWGISTDRLTVKQGQVLDELVRNSSRPQWLRGFAGSGKTVLMVHLAERLLSTDSEASFCFISFTLALNDLIVTGFRGESADRVTIVTHDQFLRESEQYKYVFVDEVQDICAGDLEKIRGLSTHLFLSGDPDQTIYDVDCSGRHIMDSLSPRVHVLKEVFRLTQTLLDVAVSVYPPADGSAVGVEVMEGKESSVKLVHFSSSRAENTWVFQEASKLSRPGAPGVILLPNHLAIGSFARDVAEANGLPEPDGAGTENGGRNYFKLNAFWKQHGISLMYLGNGFGSLDVSERQPQVYLMTLHSAKGLDFETVFLPGMSREATLLEGRDADKNVDMLRRLLFVGLTRSRCDLFISFSGEGLHETMRMLPELSAVNELVEPSEDDGCDDDEDWI